MILARDCVGWNRHEVVEESASFSEEKEAKRLYLSRPKAFQTSGSGIEKVFARRRPAAF
jgi:hypothetical protein